MPTMDMDKVVCYCMGVTNGAVKAAVDAGASTLAEVQAETGASTVCGACMENHLIKDILFFYMSFDFCCSFFLFFCIFL